jgi:ABC-type lipoprotein release transport system permease subunit
VLVLAAVWIGLLALSNVRERATEIGILRAIGVRARAIVRVFITRAMITGLLGAAIGYVAGLAVAVLVERSSPSLRVDSSAALFEPRLLAIVLVAAPLLAMLASWAPAMLAGRQDPAVILARE